MSDIRTWLERNDHIITELHEAQTAAAGSAGDLARALDCSSVETDVDAAAELASFHADNFQVIICRARDLPPIPDVETHRHFTRALVFWQEGAEAQSAAARERSAEKAQRAGQAYQDAGDEGFRMAAALRRATGQPPDPRTQGY